MLKILAQDGKKKRSPGSQVVRKQDRELYTYSRKPNKINMKTKDVSY